MPSSRRIATLVAWAYVMEAIAIDDALDVLNLLVKDILAKSQTDGKKNRLRTIKAYSRHTDTVGESNQEKTKRNIKQGDEYNFSK